MQVAQIYALVNQAHKELTGVTEVLQEDLSNLMDIGTEVFNTNNVDNYVKKMIDQIGKFYFVERKHTNIAPSVFMDSWEWGSVACKMEMELPEDSENADWDVEDATSYDPFVTAIPTINVKYFNKKATFKIKITLGELQVKESFTGVEQMNGFISMIFNAIDRKLRIDLDALTMRLFINAIGETVASEFPEGGYGDDTGIRAINLLKLYNDEHPTATLTASTCIRNADFDRFATEQMGLIRERLRAESTLFNINGKTRQTADSDLHSVLLADFVKACESNLYSNTFHEEYVKAPNADVVPYWQGSGTAFAFGSVSKINAKVASGAEVVLDGILGCMYDRRALGIFNEARRTQSLFNPENELTNYWFKEDGHYFNDFDENFIVFYVADSTEE